MPARHREPAPRFCFFPVIFLTLLFLSPWLLAAPKQGPHSRILFTQDLVSPDGNHAIVVRRDATDRSVYIYGRTGGEPPVPRIVDQSVLKAIFFNADMMHWSRTGRDVAWPWPSSVPPNMGWAVSTARLQNGRVESLATRLSPADVADYPLGWFADDLVIARLGNHDVTWLRLDAATGEYSSIEVVFPEGMQMEQIVPTTSRPGRNSGSVLVRALVVLPAEGERGVRRGFTTFFEFSIDEGKKTITARPIVMVCLSSGEIPRGYRIFRLGPERGRLLDWSVVGDHIFIAVELHEKKDLRRVEVWRVVNNREDPQGELVCVLPNGDHRVSLSPFSPAIAFEVRDGEGVSHLAVGKIAQDAVFRNVISDVGIEGSIGGFAFVGEDVLLAAVGGRVVEIRFGTSPALITPLRWGESEKD